MEKPRLVACKCHVSSRGGKYFHGRNRQPPREIPRGATHGHACKNEVVIERYRISGTRYVLWHKYAFSDVKHTRQFNNSIIIANKILFFVHCMAIQTLLIFQCILLLMYKYVNGNKAT